MADLHHRIQANAQTAEPLAKVLGVEPTVIAQKDVRALVDRLQSIPGSVLVVGHSNTVPEIVKALGVADADFHCRRPNSTTCSLCCAARRHPCCAFTTDDVCSFQPSRPGRVCGRVHPGRGAARRTTALRSVVVAAGTGTDLGR